MREENFSRNAKPIVAIGVELRKRFDVFEPVLISGLRSEMSLEFEYRRLAATCLDLSQRAAAPADKTRLLLIAEAWLELADRVTRKRGNARRRNDGSTAHPRCQKLEPQQGRRSLPSLPYNGMQ
jgi:hypothetical protein